MPFDGRNQEAIAVVEKMEEILAMPEKWQQGDYYGAGRTCLWGAYCEARTGCRVVLRSAEPEDPVANAMLAEINARRKAMGSAATLSDVHTAACVFNNTVDDHTMILEFLVGVKARL